MSRLTAPSLLRRVLESRALPTPHTAPSSELSGSVSQHERLATSGGCLSSQPLYPSHVVSHGWCCWTLPAVAGTGLHCSPAHLLTVRTGATHNGWAPQHHTTPLLPPRISTRLPTVVHRTHHITSHHITSPSRIVTISLNTFTHLECCDSLRSGWLNIYFINSQTDYLTNK